MKRLTGSLMLVCAALFAPGCENKNTDAAMTVDPTFETTDSSGSLDQLESRSASNRWADDGAAYAPPPLSGTNGDSYATASDETLVPSATGASLAATTAPTYIVRKGDTMMQVSRNVYGDARRWREIWEANKTRVPDPNRLRVGDKLIIPR